MEEQEPIRNTPSFNEDAWIKLVFLLNDTQDWLNELANVAVMQVPMKKFRKH